MSKNKKVKNEYCFWDFIKSHWILSIILGAIPICAVIVFSFLMGYKICGINDLGSFLGGLLAYIGTALLGAVSMWQNEKLKIENDRALEKQKEQAEHDKKILLEHNARIAYDGIRFSALPIFSVKKIDYRIRKRLDDISEPKYNFNDDAPYGYSEKDSDYYAIKLSKNGIMVSDKQIPEIKKFKDSLFRVENDRNGALVFAPKQDGYVPYIIKNVGKHDAMGFSFAIYKEGSPDEGFKRSASYRPFSLTDVLRLDFYIEDYSDQAVYWLEFRYKDVFGNQYRQKDYIKLQGDDAEYSLLFNQELVEKSLGQSD